MRDLIGRTLGHYRIVEKIGEGGMGEVYRAHDERLDRDVAIKVLPEAVAEDAQRLARFEREAKLLASLSHQNVATLHGLEVHEGQRFLVMELADGETLAERIMKGPIVVEEALEIARQIAEGLEAAHEQGIIHRDLKPANVMVSPGGKVKVLDFGLAKVWHLDESDADLTHSPTLTAQMTAAGVLLGTAAYMSPEQARGKTADKRADIWAFGVVLFEMLTGARLFGGETTSDVLAAVLRAEPDWSELPAETPRPVVRLLRSCLAKDPHDRFHDIADARIVLQSKSIDDDSKDGASFLAPRRPGWRSWLPWGLAAVFAALCVGIFIWHLGTPSPGGVTKTLVGIEPAQALGIGRLETAQSVRLSLTAMALSPEGRHLVYSASDQKGSRLYLRAMDEIRGTPIDGTEGGEGPFFSPDGNWIGFWADGSLKKVRIDGGPVVPVCDAPPPYGASWSPSNTIVFGQNEGGILRVSADGGEPEEITALAEGEYAHRHPQLLNDGDSLLFTSVKGFTWEWDRHLIVAQSLSTGEGKILVENGADPRYAPTGHLVFSRLGTLMAAPFDPKRLEVTGGAVVVLESVRQGVNAITSGFDTLSGQFAFSSSGALVYVPGGVWPDAQNSLVWVDREGQTEHLSVPPGPFECPRLSPDGTRIAVTAFGFEQKDIWVYDIARGTMTRLTLEESEDTFPVWTPNSTQIAFESNRSGDYAVHWTPADGSGPVELLATLDATPASWSPDGQVLACVFWNDTGSADIWMVPLEGEPQPFIESRFFEGWPEFSPDGRWLAYTSNQSGQREVYVTPYPGPGPRVQISDDYGVGPLWSPNGRELFYRGWSASEEMFSTRSVEIITEPSFSSGRTRELFIQGFPTGSPTRNHDITPDGKRFLMVSEGPQQEEPVTQIHVTLNWFEELKRLAPTE